MNEDIKQWDEWFDLVGMSKEWAVVKDRFPDDVNRQLRWAEIMELNRIDAETGLARRKEVQT